jgi:putative membrane protein
MDAGTIIGAAIGIGLGTVVYAILLWIVGKLGLGVTVKGFPSALLAGLLVAIGGAIAAWLGTQLDAPAAEGLTGAVSHLIIATGVLKALGSGLSGIEVRGWGAAFLGALAIAALGWVINFGLAAVAAG